MTTAIRWSWLVQRRLGPWELAASVICQAAVGTGSYLIKVMPDATFRREWD